jgi:hypothetical protein
LNIANGSITVYNAKGFYEVPQSSIAAKNSDRGVTVHFGGAANQSSYQRIIWVELHCAPLPAAG